MRANRLLDSAKPENVELRDRLAAKKTDDSYQGKWCPCWVLSRLILCADRWSLLLLSLHVWVQKRVKSMHFCQIHHNLTCSEDLCKLGKEHLNALTCKYSFLQTKFWNFWHITRLSPINHRKVINCQKWSIFCSPCINTHQSGFYDYGRKLLQILWIQHKSTHIKHLMWNASRWSIYLWVPFECKILSECSIWEMGHVFRIKIVELHTSTLIYLDSGKVLLKIYVH